MSNNNSSNFYDGLAKVQDAFESEYSARKALAKENQKLKQDRETGIGLMKQLDEEADLTLKQLMSTYDELETALDRVAELEAAISVDDGILEYLSKAIKEKHDELFTLRAENIRLTEELEGADDYIGTLFSENNALKAGKK